VSTSKSKVIILGDSHLKLSVPRIYHYLSSKFEVSGFIKPGAGFEKIVGKTILGSSRLTKKDVLVCYGGANDATTVTQKKTVLQIMKFFQDNDKSNIIMLDIPHRYDLPDNSHVNKDIKTFSSKLKKITRLFKHVTILEFSFTRNCFTQHGLHPKGYGKRILAKQLVSLIYKMSCQKTEEPISLEWKMGLNDNPTSHPSNMAPNFSKTQPDTVTCRTSTRTKKPPITKQNDFS
jgi:hypothetical protein